MRILKHYDLKRLIKKIRNWEQWPFNLLYAPISPVWVWYIIRSKSVWFFTASNPKLSFGGMEGEPKQEMYNLLPKEYFPETFNVLPSDDLDKVVSLLNQHQISFPLVAKPEVGGQGIMVRKIDTLQKLKSYHEHSPVEYMIQELVTYKMEVSVFYFRLPHSEKGNISGFLLKIPLLVTGTGYQTLQQLINAHPKAVKRAKELKRKHFDQLSRILAEGEIFHLSHAANHNRGAQFISLEKEIDGKLTSLFDTISNHDNGFFYGRYDIMCNSVNDLKNGKNFKILEYNGSGAEPNHFYDTGYTLVEAYREILHHWKMLYKISKQNKNSGIEYWPFMKGMKFLMNSKKHLKKIRKADKKLHEII
ncbi:hypothetical protein BH09BAC2_BH09BAC2_09140 [soil metagenome]